MRPGRTDDHAAVCRVHALALGRRGEADLVDRLRAADRAVVSLVAEDAGRVVGHILFSPCRSGRRRPLVPRSGSPPWPCCPTAAGRASAPRSCAGASTSAAGSGTSGSSLLEHPAYDRRFGFRPASRFGLRREYHAPADAFMAMALRPGASKACAGTAVYAPEFASVA